VSQHLYLNPTSRDERSEGRTSPQRYSISIFDGLSHVTAGAAPGKAASPLTAAGAARATLRARNGQIRRGDDYSRTGDDQAATLIRRGWIVMCEPGAM